jgi:hypothetical protein
MKLFGELTMPDPGHYSSSAIASQIWQNASEPATGEQADTDMMDYSPST